MTVKGQWIACFVAAAALVAFLRPGSAFSWFGYLIAVLVVGFLIAGIFGNSGRKV